MIEPRLSAFEAAAGGAGFSMRSGRMVAASAGGQSWLNHASVSSGRFIDDQTLYALFLSERPRTLVDDFSRAGWRTVQAMPAITMPWPEGQLLGYDATYEAGDMGYAGPFFYWGIVPDQFALDHLARTELDRVPGGADRPPIFAIAALISSHAPWLPRARGRALGGSRRRIGLPPLDRRRAGAARGLARSGEGAGPNTHSQVAHSIDAVAAFVAERLGPGDGGDRDGRPPAGAADHGRGTPRAPRPVHVLARDEALLAPFEALGFAPGALPPPAPLVGDAALPRIDALRPALLEGWRGERAAGEHATRGATTTR